MKFIVEFLTTFWHWLVLMPWSSFSVTLPRPIEKKPCLSTGAYLVPSPKHVRHVWECG